ncbi:MAG: lipid A deacylase LpxR family protein [Alphaproteobacteria bacterium]|nr:lipid A deacylase LpxR family protein [Alphaproteobacteria bacterium]NCQ87638.1 lipid A deacylase LpxR family protein [Alphaproteobacteria bacterium]NCT05853.1 lipid A deacylase LpxR family protein [Alphaproteobacteria bacterium]
MHFVFKIIFLAVILAPSISWAQDGRVNPAQASAITKQLNDQKTVEQTITDRVKNSDDHNYLSFSYENDLIGGGTDENYTSGLRITYFDTEATVPAPLVELAEFIPTFDLNETTATFFTFGQNIYTPQDITIRPLQQNDRPYAAWIYGSVGLATVTKDHIDELEFTLGVVGPEALGEQTQKLIHRHLTNSDIPKGWSHQLKFEPGAIISWRRRWPAFYTANIGDFRLRAEPDVNISLGNVYTYAGTGGVITFGPYNDRIQDTPPRVRPSMPGTGFFDTPDRDFSWNLFAGLDGRAMGRNIFLDGNTFRNSHDVDKKILVGDVNAGLAISYDDYRLSYTLNYRTREFDGQDDPSIFGSISLTTRF